MTPDQVRVVVSVYNHLISNEARGWDSLDDYIECLEWLSDDQIHREADVIFEIHSRGLPSCKQDHPREKCFVPVLIDAVQSIIGLYKETNSLHPKNRYILHYYLAMNQADMIVMEA